MLTEHVSPTIEVPLIVPQALGADHTSSVLDVTVEPHVCNARTFVISLGASGAALSAANKIEFSVEGSDDGGTTWTTVPAADLVVPQGTALSGNVLPITKAADVSKVYEIGVLRSHGRYRVKADFSGDHSGGDTHIGVNARLDRLASSRLAS